MDGEKITPSGHWFIAYITTSLTGTISAWAMQRVLWSVNTATPGPALWEDRSECLLSMVEEGNPHHYFVASQVIVLLKPESILIISNYDSYGAI